MSADVNARDKNQTNDRENERKKRNFALQHKHLNFEIKKYNFNYFP